MSITTTNSFESVDITHKSKRYQGDWDNESVDEESGAVVSVPNRPTIEGAIRFFRENAKGELEGLYNITAEYLEEYRRLKVVLKGGVKHEEAENPAD